MNENYIKNNTDKYFTRTKEILKKHQDNKVVYAFFVRKPSIYAPKLALEFINKVVKNLGFNINVYENFQEGDKVPAGDPLFFLEGKFSELSELETLILQRVGLSCLCAWNAYSMSRALEKTSFISMLARHCVNEEMVEACEYGASVGSKTAQKQGAIGFIGGSTDHTCKYFNTKEGLGTMPHSLIGYAGSTLEAANMYYNTFLPDSMTVLIDYFGAEVRDSLAVCEAFREMAKDGNLSLRIDTHGGRFLEGLDSHKSNEIIEKYVPKAFHSYKDSEDLEYLLGMGVSGAAIFYMRECLNNAGFEEVKLVVSSGFNIKKCLLMSEIKAPIDVVGTGSYIPQTWSDTYTTADIVSYDGRLSVKQGREFLIERWKNKLSSLNTN